MSLPVFSVAEIRDIEAQANAQGYTYTSMMEDAGRVVAEHSVSMLNGTEAPRITILIGKGNNGGDGLVAARILAEILPDAQVRAYLVEKREDDPLLESALARGVFVSYAEDDHDGRVIKHMSASADLFIDALFGIGIRLPIRETAQRILRYVRQALNERANARRTKSLLDATIGGQIERAPKQFVLAVDCPSGIDCDTGESDSVSLKADVTITFIAAKPGLISFPAAAQVGKLLVAPLNMPESLGLANRAKITLTDNETARDLLPPRPLDGHKGTFGRVLLAAGSDTMPGAAGLAAKSAYRCGAGLVEIATTGSAVRALQTHLLEAVWSALPDTYGYLATEALTMLQARVQHADALVIGPGLGGIGNSGSLVTGILQAVIKDAPHLAVILDADALNILAPLPNWPTFLPQNAIITPHPAEMARLLSSETSTVQKDRLRLALQAASDWKTVVVLKGAHTIVASPDGKAAISPFKTDALSKGGTGDVLAGVIGTLRAQNMKPFDAARLGVYLHGLAGIIATGKTGHSAGVTASDVADALPDAFSRILAG